MGAAVASGVWLMRDRDTARSTGSVTHSDGTHAQDESSPSPQPGAPASNPLAPGLLDDPSLPPRTRIAVRALLAQNDNLRLEVERLRKSTAPPERGQDDRSHGFTRDEWAAMATRCELRWDHPGIGNDDQPPRIDDEHAQELGLTVGQRDAANEVLRQHDRAAREEIRRIYVAATGDIEGGGWRSAR